LLYIYVGYCTTYTYIEKFEDEKKKPLKYHGRLYFCIIIQKKK
jgi:hypothetical protein